MPHLMRAAAAALVFATPWAWAQDVNLARNLAATCANCHGTNGNARGDMKQLAGVSAEKILAAIADYNRRERRFGLTSEQLKPASAK